ncbi:hypothetical protein A3K64_01875 [Candidatus Micrarchaeota archaeon RBG_16_36_9]|nr:MAG: hypothetical protein A3K64_01875 [Candidatus Micrarchaeota archaeon RBG_16_36_9]
MISYIVRGSKCVEGELVLILKNPSSAYRVDFNFVKLSVNQLISLKEKYGLKWDGTESSAESLNGKMIEL